jgi:hypothetical protein
MAEQAIHDVTRERSVTRLYRGLSRSYRLGQVDSKELLHGTNFTDCPMAALAYARGRNGVLLVVDVPEDVKIRMSDAIWLLDGSGPRRVMLWGCPFDPYIVAEIPAKELRAEVRKRGVRTLPDSEKGRILVRYLEQRISRTMTVNIGRFGLYMNSPEAINRG